MDTGKVRELMIHLTINRPQRKDLIEETVSTIGEAQSLIGAALQDRDDNPDTDKMDGDVYVSVGIRKAKSKRIILERLE